MAKIDQPFFSIFQNKATPGCKAATIGCILQRVVGFCGYRKPVTGQQVLLFNADNAWKSPEVAKI